MRSSWRFDSRPTWRLRSVRSRVTICDTLATESFGKPVLVLRKVTERPEASMRGLSVIVGTSRERIVEEASRLLSNRDAYRRMSEAASPYGDGRASERIVKAISRWFRGEQPALEEFEQFDVAAEMAEAA